MIALKNIQAARGRIESRIHCSPCAYSETVSQMAGNRVFFKRSVGYSVTVRGLCSTERIMMRLSRKPNVSGKERANILQIEHVRGFEETAIGETEVELILETTGREHIHRINQALRGEGLRINVGPSKDKPRT